MSATSKFPEATTPDARRTPTLLIVDDNDAIRELIALVLSSAGQILTARDGVDAVKVLLEKKPGDVALLITDRLMPRMGGDELAAWFLSWNPHAKVLVVSTDLPRPSADPNIRYLAKPFEVATLSRVVGKLLSEQVAVRGGSSACQV